MGSKKILEIISSSDIFILSSGWESVSVPPNPERIILELRKQ
jgi:hypothetical protein